MPGWSLAIPGCADRRLSVRWGGQGALTDGYLSFRGKGHAEAVVLQERGSRWMTGPSRPLGAPGSSLAFRRVSPALPAEHMQPTCAPFFVAHPFDKTEGLC